MNPRRLGPARMALLLCFAVLCLPASAIAQQFEEVSACQLLKNPRAYNHKLVQVTAFVSHGFEDFTLFDPHCFSWPPVWLEYGGKVASGTMYCCGVTNARTRHRQLRVEQIPVPLVDDGVFREFDNLIQRPPSSLVRATLVGRFFAGRLQRSPRSAFGGGFGHFGCCSLLAIQQVLSVGPQDRDDLDYNPDPDQPRADKIGCGYRDLRFPLSPGFFDGVIHAQEAAEAGPRQWAFNDPQRVALDFLARFLETDLTSIQGMKRTRATQGRVIYSWKPPKKKMSFMIVVSRPYWLSFYARNPGQIAWTILAAYESSCGKGNSVTRIH